MQTETLTTRTAENNQVALRHNFTPAELNQLEEYREKLYVAPPGVENAAITEAMPPVAEIVNDLYNSTRIYKNSREAAINTGIPQEDYDELMAKQEVALADIMLGFQPIKPNEAPNKYTGIEKHWKKLLKTLPANTTIRSYGDLVLAEYPLGMPLEDERGRVTPPNLVKVIFDLGTGSSSREQGIKIRAMLQERGEDGGCFNAAGQLPGFSNIYFKKEGWLIELLQGTGGAIATASSGYGNLPARVDVLTFTVGKSGLGGDTLVHELIHISDYRKGTLNSMIPLKLATLNENLLLPLSAIASIVTLNPWIIMPSLMATVAAYLSSRVEGHSLNRNIKDRFALEKRAYLYQLIFTMLMEKNGFQFTSGHPYHTVPELTPQYIERTNTHLIRYYQPMVWGLIDSIRLKSDGNGKLVEPKAAYSYSF